MEIWKNYVIWYSNPHIRFDDLRILKDVNGDRVIIKARNKEESVQKARKRLRTTGMIFKTEAI